MLAIRALTDTMGLSSCSLGWPVVVMYSLNHYGLPALSVSLGQASKLGESSLV